MDQFVIILQLTVRASDADTAHDFGMGLADHLLETSDDTNEIEGHRIEVKTSRIGDRWSDNDREGVQTKQHWIAGTNVPGYLPDNAPEIFDDFEMAKSYIMSEIDADIDDLDVDQEDEVDDLKRAHARIAPLTGPFEYTANNRVYFIQKAEQ